MLDRAIGLVGLALALIFGLWSLAPEGWPKAPLWAITAGLAGAIFLIGLAAGLILADRRNTKVATPAHTAELHLHTFGDERAPTRLSFDNVWRWYLLTGITAHVDAGTGQEIKRSVVQTLFVTFEREVRIGTLEVSSPDFRLPVYEVKEYTPRYAIIVFIGQLPAGTLVIRVRP